MSNKDDVQREIEENQRRARDEQDVGLEEDELVNREQDGGTILDDLGEAVFGDESESRKRDVEYDDSDGGTNKFIPD